MRRVWLLCALACCVPLVACSGDDAGPGSVPLLEGERVEAEISAAQGGIVVCPGGARLEIPPGALAQDVTVTMTPLDLGSDPDGDVFAGVELLPHGLTFATPAQLTLPLARPLPPLLELQLAEDPSGRSRFGSLGSLLRVGQGGRSATGWIDGFSSKLVMKNCHAGTRDALIEAWEGVPGRELDALVAATGLSPEDLTTCDLEADPLQQVLSATFERTHEFPPDAPVTAEALAAIRAALDSDRQVVLLFGRSLGGSPPQATGVAHSAVVVDLGGRLVIRNQLNITDPSTFARLEERGGSTTLDSALEDIDRPGVGMRDMRAGEVMTSVLFGQPLQDRERRSKVWPHLAVYVEKPRPGGPPACELVDVTPVNATPYEDHEVTVIAERAGASFTLGFRTESRRFHPGDRITLTARTVCLLYGGVCLDPERSCRFWGPETFVLGCDGLTWTVSGGGQLAPECE